MAEDDRPLTDNQVDDRLKAARDVLGDAPGRTTIGDTAITAARKALDLLSMGLLVAQAKADPPET